MVLSPGARLGPYEIAGAIGAGGMGEVFRARDTRLDRDVALKVLSAAAAADSERMRRFEQEGRRTPIASVGPADADGITVLNAPLVSADGLTYVYRYNQILCDLFASDRLR